MDSLVKETDGLSVERFVRLRILLGCDNFGFLSDADRNSISVFNNHRASSCEKVNLHLFKS